MIIITWRNRTLRGPEDSCSACRSAADSSPELQARRYSALACETRSERQGYLLARLRQSAARARPTRTNGLPLRKVRPGVPSTGGPMARPKSERRSSDLEAEIARLEEERNRLVQSEDQRRGAIIRELLTGPSGDSLRASLQPLVATRDAFLFGLDGPSGNSKAARSHASNIPSVGEPSPREPIEAVS